MFRLFTFRERELPAGHEAAMRKAATTSQQPPTIRNRKWYCLGIFGNFPNRKPKAGIQLQTRMANHILGEISDMIPPDRYALHYERPHHGPVLRQIYTPDTQTARGRRLMAVNGFSVQEMSYRIDMRNIFFNTWEET